MDTCIDSCDCKAQAFVAEHAKYCPFVLAFLALTVVCIHHCMKRCHEDKLKKHIMEAIKKYENKYGEITKKERKYIVEEVKKALKEDMEELKKKK